MTAEMARVSAAEKDRSPENTMDFNQELDTIVEGVQHKNQLHQASPTTEIITGPEGVEKSNEERTFDEFFETMASK